MRVLRTVVKVIGPGIAALAVSAPAWAHGGQSVTAPIGSAPTIDGAVGVVEWADAAQLPLPYAGHAGTLYVKHDAANVYFAATIADSAPNPDLPCCSLGLYFDNDHDGIHEAGDDGLVFNRGTTSGGDFFYSPSTGNHPFDTQDGGTSDIVEAGGYDAQTATISFEGGHPLCTADTTHDFCVAPGATVGFTTQYLTSAGSFLPGYPVDFPLGDGYADLSIGIADTTPPETTILSGPSDPTTQTVANFTFGSSEPGSTFFCALDGSGLDNCPSDAEAFYRDLGVGQHTFEVQAIDAAGNPDDTPAKQTWTVEAAPPPDTQGRTLIASLTAQGAQADAASESPSLSDDGNLVGFESPATNITTLGNGGGFKQAYVRDRTTGSTFMVSFQNAIDLFLPGNADSGWVQVSGDGTVVTFQSLANNFSCPGNTCLPDTTTSHVYRKALPGTVVTFVDALGTTVANGNSQHPSISKDGRFIAFDSTATNLLGAGGDTNDASDVFVRDMTNGEIKRVSVQNGTAAEAVGESTYPSISADGNFVAFLSAARLSADDKNDFENVYVRDLQNGRTILVDVSSAGVQGNFDAVRSVPPSISADGSRVAFASFSDNLAPGVPIDNGSHIFVRDIPKSTTVIADVSGTGERANSESTSPSISDDGSSVEFTSTASNLSPLVDTTSTHTWVRDLGSGATLLVDLSPEHLPGDGSSRSGIGSLSADGRFAAFWSDATSLLGRGKDANAVADVFVRELGGTATGARANLVADEPGSSEAGASRLPIDAFPLSVLEPPPAGSTTGSPIDDFPIDDFPIDDFPIDDFPIDDFPIDDFPFDDPSVVNELGAVPLADIGTTYPGGWPKVLEGSQYDGVPPQSVSLKQLIQANPKSPALNPTSGRPQLMFDQLDFSHSSLGSLPFEALAVGATQLSALDPAGGGSALADWCTALSGPPINCDPANPSATIGTQTVLGASLAGAPIDDFPIDDFPIDDFPTVNFPIDDFPIDDFPIDDFPIDNLPLSVSPIDDFPIDDFNLALSGFATLPMKKILDAGSPLGTIPVATLTNQSAVVAGGTLEPTLAAANSAGHVLASATLSDLAGDLSGFTLGDIQFYGDPPLTVMNLLDGLHGTANDFTLTDLLAIFLTRADISWESLSTETLSKFGTNGEIGWHAEFTVTGAGEGEATVKVKLPPAARYDGAKGSTLTLDGQSVAIPDPVVDGQTLTWTLPDVLFGAQYSVDFHAYAGFKLGPTAGSMEVSADGPAGTVSATDTEPVTTTQTFDNPDVTPIIQPNTEVDQSYIAQPGEVDFFRIPMPAAGSRLTIHMTNLPADFDLTLYAPTATNLVNPGTSDTPLENRPVPDRGVRVSNLGDQLEPAALADIATTNLPIAGQSIFRGTDPEDITVVSPGGLGFFTLAVSGYSGAFSPLPYSLRVTSRAPRPFPATCSDARVLPNAGQGVAGSVALSIPTNVNTLFLVNQKRLGDTYGAGPAGDGVAALNALKGRGDLGVSGAVIPVEAYGTTAADYAAWDAAKCSPEAANKVAADIAAIIDSIHDSRPALKYVVFVGGDDQIPQFRVPDLTVIANEYGEAGAFDPNEYFGAFYREDLLSDDPYLDSDPVQSGTRQIFLPDLVGGRLVETPGDIVAQVNQYISSGGILLKQSAFSSGYDFASDGTTAGSDNLASIVGTSHVRTLINETWNRSDLLSALFPTSGASSINQLNGHYDHYRALPAAGNSTGDTSDMLTTADIDAHPNALALHTLFSIGCHAGLAVSDVVVGATSPIKRDWAQTYAAQRAIFAANTGFGLGATDSIAYSEQLMALFASHLDGSLSVGQALALAKSDYFLGRVNFSAYEQKTTLEATMYGLPFFGVGTAPAPVGAAPPAPPAPASPVPGATSSTAPAASPISIDPLSGLRGAAFAAVPSFTLTHGTRGDFLSNAGIIALLHYRPIVSELTLPATKSGEKAHSAIVESLTSRDDSPWNPALVMPTDDLSALSPEPTFTNIGFPSAIQNTVTARTPGGIQSQLDLGTSQFFTDDTPGHAGQPVMRRWLDIRGHQFYNSSTDYDPPTILQSRGTRFGSNVGFVVSACDSVRVLILFDDLGDPATPDVWRPVELAKDPAAGSCRWTGGAPIIGPNIQYIVQACDANGNCAKSTNKAHYFQAQTQPPSTPGSDGGITITLNGDSTPPSFFSGAVTVNASDSGPAALRTTIDGEVRALPATVSSDGLHVVQVDASDGGQAFALFVIDATGPTVVLRTPSNGAVYTAGQTVLADYSCRDAGSGVDTCAGPVANGAPINTSTVGFIPFKVTATDHLGHSASVTNTYQVVWPFDGFFKPVINPPTLNLMSAGSAVPIKFSLGGNRGLNIFAPGSPTSVAIKCDSRAPVVPVDEIVTANTSSLAISGGSNIYIYNWKTDKKWVRTCRQFVMKLVDGTEHRANFEFK